MSKKELIVIGGGAAGFFCAVNAARMNPGLRVTILEKSNKLLSKVRISGGGRCNLTHACFDISEMMKKYPRGGNFVKKTFHTFFTTDTINWFQERGVQVKQEPDGRMFPVSNSSESVIDCLMNEARRFNVNIIMQADVTAITRTDAGLFRLGCTGGKNHEADYVCIATGGYPKSTMFGWLKQLGHSINEPVPSLFTLNIPKHPITELMGVSVEQARIRVNGMKLEQQGPLLITHWGFSGPGVLRLSAWGARLLAEAQWNCTVQVNWIPSKTEQELRDQFASLRYSIASQKVGGKNQFGLPNRLWDFMLASCNIRPETRWADLPSKETNKLIKNLNAGDFEVKGKTTYKEEFVTAGGIKPEEIDASTMMSRKEENIFFAGEVMDVDGITGGFNFQHAWTSGYIAAKSIAERAAGTVARP